MYSPYRDRFSIRFCLMVFFIKIFLRNWKSAVHAVHALAVQGQVFDQVLFDGLLHNKYLPETGSAADTVHVLAVLCQGVDQIGLKVLHNKNTSIMGGERRRAGEIFLFFREGGGGSLPSSVGVL